MRAHANIQSQATSQEVVWKMVDLNSQQGNMAIAWQFKAGDKVKIRIVNEEKSEHPMQHPIHFHGQRFLVLTTNGVKNSNLVWKDTVLVQTGDTVDLLLDASNPGQWMAHCHISEHLSSNMAMTFEVN